MARQVNLDTPGLFRIFEHLSSSIVTNSNWCLAHVQRQRGPSSESGHYRFVQTFERPSLVTFYPTFMSLKLLSKLYRLFRPRIQGFIDTKTKTDQPSDEPFQNEDKPSNEPSAKLSDEPATHVSVHSR